MKSGTMIALVCLLIFGQCSTGKDPVLSPKIARLVGIWQLADATSATNVTLEFALDLANPPNDVTPLKATGKSSVNTYSGFLSAALDGLMIFTALSSTQLAGSAEATQFEQAYFDNLKNVVRYEVTDKNRLHLFHGGAKPGVLLYDKIN